MTRAAESEDLRPLQFPIAYRIPGSVAEAKDAVQETWLRDESSPAQPASAKAFLPAAVTPISVDVLRSARVRREAYVGSWSPEPLLTTPARTHGGRPGRRTRVSMAAPLLERQAPLKRAVFVLREVSGFGAGQAASAAGRSEAACRQFAVRAPGRQSGLTLALDIPDGPIQTIRPAQNPGTLGHLGPAADAWAVTRELNQARRPAD